MLPLRESVIELLKEAERQLNEELFKSWHLARSNPDVWKAKRQGAEDFRLRATRLLDGDAA